MPEIIDSIALKAHADSLAHTIRIPQEAGADTIIDTDLDHALAARYSTDSINLKSLCRELPPPKSTWHDGLEGTHRTINAGDNSGVLAIVTGVFVLMMLSYRKCSRIFSVLTKELVAMRAPNLFDEHTSNETGVLTLMSMQWSVYTGLLLYTLLSLQGFTEPQRAFPDIVTLILLMGGYYVFQLVAYRVVGFTFSTPESSRFLVEGFTSSQSLLGFALVIPGLVAIFYHQASQAMLIVGGALYLLARIIFLVKGFRIFYQNYFSLFYFILYLCTLEIIPLIVLYNIALFLVKINII